MRMFEGSLLSMGCITVLVVLCAWVAAVEQQCSSYHIEKDCEGKTQISVDGGDTGVESCIWCPTESSCTVRACPSCADYSIQSCSQQVTEEGSECFVCNGGRCSQVCDQCSGYGKDRCGGKNNTKGTACDVCADDCQEAPCPSCDLIGSSKEECFLSNGPRGGCVWCGSDGCRDRCATCESHHDQEACIGSFDNSEEGCIWCSGKCRIGKKCDNCADYVSSECEGSYNAKDEKCTPCQGRCVTNECQQCEQVSHAADCVKDIRGVDCVWCGSYCASSNEANRHNKEVCTCNKAVTTQSICPSTLGPDGYKCMWCDSLDVCSSGPQHYQFCHSCSPFVTSSYRFMPLWAAALASLKSVFVVIAWRQLVSSFVGLSLTDEKEGRNFLRRSARATRDLPHWSLIMIYTCTLLIYVGTSIADAARANPSENPLHEKQDLDNSSTRFVLAGSRLINSGYIATFCLTILQLFSTIINRETTHKTEFDELKGSWVTIGMIGTYILTYVVFILALVLPGSLIAPWYMLCIILCFAMVSRGQSMLLRLFGSSRTTSSAADEESEGLAATQPLNNEHTLGYQSTDGRTELDSSQSLSVFEYHIKRSAEGRFGVIVFVTCVTAVLTMIFVASANTAALYTVPKDGAAGYMESLKRAVATCTEPFFDAGAERSRQLQVASVFCPGL